jgi:hypothetical protein
VPAAADDQADNSAHHEWAIEQLSLIKKRIDEAVPLALNITRSVTQTAPCCLNLNLIVRRRIAPS